MTLFKWVLILAIFTSFEVSSQTLIQTSVRIPSQTPIKVYYNERLPYLEMKDGELVGLTGGPAVAAFKAAGIPIILVPLRAIAQLEELKTSDRACGIGWFKTKGRESIGKFTKAIYTDKPFIIFAHTNTTIKDGSSVETVLYNDNLVMLVKRKYSYGDFFDNLIIGYQTRTLETGVEDIFMLQMIAYHKADYMLITPEEASTLIEAARLDKRNFSLFNFSNPPEGETRHIFCSKSVPDSMIDKLNEAITNNTK